MVVSCMVRHHFPWWYQPVVWGWPVVDRNQLLVQIAGNLSATSPTGACIHVETGMSPLALAFIMLNYIPMNHILENLATILTVGSTQAPCAFGLVIPSLL